MVAPAPALKTMESASQNPLTRRWLLNLALLVLVLALGGYAWYRSSRAPVETKPTLTTLSADAVEAIEVARPEQPAVRLQRTDGQWRLTAPLNARADSFAIDSLLRMTQAPIDSTITPADAELARYGLDRPRLTVRLNDTEIRFGEAHPLKDEHYVQYQSRVHLIPNRYYAQAAMPYTNFIDSRLIEPGRKLTGFKLPDFALRLQDSEWRREPGIEALSSDRINGFVDDWRHARALQVEKYGGKKAQQQVVITTEDSDGKPTDLRIEVISREPEFVLYRPDEGLEYHFPQDTARRLLTLSAETAEK